MNIFIMFVLGLCIMREMNEEWIWSEVMTDSDNIYSMDHILLKDHNDPCSMNSWKISERKRKNREWDFKILFKLNCWNVSSVNREVPQHTENPLMFSPVLSQWTMSNKTDRWLQCLSSQRKNFIKNECRHFFLFFALTTISKETSPCSIGSVEISSA